MSNRKKRCPDQIYTNKYLSFGEKIAKIDQVDPEIIGLEETFKKKEVTESKIHSPVGKLAERTKK